jgi:hypothetical protein
MPAADSSVIVVTMSTISELPPPTAESAELAFVAHEEPFTGATLNGDDEDSDDSAEAQMHRESSVAYADSVFPGYPLS